jgi:hypothetical protein
MQRKMNPTQTCKTWPLWEEKDLKETAKGCKNSLKKVRRASSVLVACTMPKEQGFFNDFNGGDFVEFF